MNILKPIEIDKYRRHIGEICRIPSNGILLNQYGRFEMHQVPEREAQQIVNALRRDPLISDVTSTAGSYDFNRMTYPGLPLRKYTVTGIITPTNEEVDDDVSSLKY